MRKLIGVALLFVGLIGLFLPLLPGIPFIVITLYVFGFISRKRLLRFLKNFGGKKRSRRRTLIAWLLRRVNIK